MSIFKGSGEIVDLKKGGTAVSKVYKGSTLVWEPAPSSYEAALLLNFDGSNESTVFTDASANAFAVTAYGDAIISTAQSKFGGASGYFDASTDTRIEIAAGSWCNFGSDNFTIEFWYRPTAPTNNSAVLSFGWDAAGISPLLVYIWNDGDIGLFASSDLSSWDVASEVVILDNPTNDTWYHIAICRSGSTIRMFVDGTQTASVSFSGSFPNAPGACAVCSRTGGGYPSGAYIDDLRVVKAALYECNFTPPASALTTTATPVTCP